MKLLAISGSLRKESSNAALLKAVHRLTASSRTRWDEADISQLPFFDPQLQFGPDVPEVVQDLRNLAAGADRILISTPEYAHGIPGILKNALEWLICEETMRKKALVFIAAPSGGEYVKEFLLETLKTMDWVVNDEDTFLARSARTDISAAGDILNSSFKESLTGFLKEKGLLS